MITTIEDLRRVAGGNPELLRRLSYKLAATFDTQQARAYAVERERVGSYLSFWIANAPEVKLRAIDNPNIPEILLTTPWAEVMAVYPAARPPIVTVYVRPRDKEQPDLGFLGGIGGAILAGVVNLVPVVGQAASAAIKLGAASSKRSYINKWSIPSRAFAPSYIPQAVFVSLPLDKAQEVVAEPWLLPVMLGQ